MAEGKRYRVEVTTTARDHFQHTLLPYLIRNFSESRVLEIDQSLEETTESLGTHPHRGTFENELIDEALRYRYILFRETRHFELKILYYVDEESSTVFVVDYFPTLMHPKRMTKPR